MKFEDIDLNSAKWISPELEDASVPRRDKNRVFSSVTPNDADFETCPDFGRHAGYLRKRFSCTPGKENVLYAAAHGVFELYMNNVKISSEVLSPGPCNAYMHMPLREYDVTTYLKDGENELVAVLGNGWYRGSCGVDGQKVLYGKDLSLYLQLLVDGRQLLVSDESWEASTDGPIRGNDLEQGEIYDAGREVNYLRRAREVRLTKDLLYLSHEPAILRHETFPGKFIRTPDGSLCLDFGQNLAGVISISLKDAPEGGHLALICGETLDAEGNFTIENFQPGKRHFEAGIRQELRLITKEGENAYTPSFTIMGFRYAKIVSDFPVEADKATFTAIAIYSDMAETAKFDSSNPDLNRLFSNCLWSQKGNFCGIPTDCPTRERSGWTGDAGLFAHTGLRLMDSYDVYEKWLSECMVSQHRNGRVPNICPPTKMTGFMAAFMSQSTGWADAVIIAPWEMYCYKGDVEVLKRFYPMMKKWYEFLIRRASKKPMKPASPKLKGRKNRKYEKYTIDKGFDYGEWKEPGFEVSDMKDSATALKDVGTAYLAYDGFLMGRIAQEIAESLPEKNGEYKRLISDSLRYSEIGEKAKAAYTHVFTEDGTISSDRQCLYVRPLSFGLLPKEKRQAAALALENNVKRAGYHLNTGFLTTPALCPVLCDYGYAGTAYRLLLNDTAPGWLYEVKQGATTLWEDWDGIDEKGRPHDSLNHYSYGAVAGFLIEYVAGIRYSHGKLFLKPVAAPELSEEQTRAAGEAVSEGKAVKTAVKHYLEHASATLHSPEGRISCGWKYETDGSITVSGSVPEGLAAEVSLPDGSTKSDVRGEFAFLCRT